MVSTIRYFFLFIVLFFAACTKNQFTLDFELPEDITDNFNVTYYATDVKGGITVQAVASVRDGKCMLEGVTKKPTLAYISTRRSPCPLVIFAKRGDKIKIKGDTNVPVEWQVEGNEINEQLSVWRLDNLNVLTEGNRDSVNLAVKKFVEKNTDSPVSTILMLCYYNRAGNEREYVDLMTSLEGEAKKEDWLRIVARSDRLYHADSYPAMLKNMVLRSDKGSSDTLIMDNKNPAFVAFWQTGYSDKAKMTDTLKVFTKDFPDSVAILADVCLDIDSAAWRTAIRRDSLNGVKRFWAPTGMVHTTMVKLQVNELPYFIVFDKEGSQHYRGNQLSEAAASYRDLMKDN